MKRIGLLTASAVILGGCTGPRIAYDISSKPDQAGAQKFQTADSMVVFTFPGPTSGVAAGMVVTSSPVAWTETTYSVSGVPWTGNWGTQTDVTATHASNSQLLSQLGVQVTDEVQAVATDAASVVQGAMTLGATVGLFAGNAAPTPLAGAAGKVQDQPPTGLLISQFIQDAVGGLKCAADKPTDTSRQPRDMKISCKQVTLSGGGKASGGALPLVNYIADVEIGPVPADAFKIVEFPYYTKALLYSACRSIKITVYDPTALDPKTKTYATLVNATTLVADPTWFEAVAIPPNGHASLNTACGADTASGAYTPPDGLKDAAGILTAINSAASALKSKGASGATGTSKN